MAHLPLWLSILVKAAFAAAVVVTATRIAERSGPLVAGLVIALPVSVGPTYVMLALTTSPEFVAASAQGSLAANIAIATMATLYVRLSRRMPMPAALLLGFCGWLGMAWGLREAALPLAWLLAANVLAYAVALGLTRFALAGRKLLAGAARWYDLPVRALSVGAFAATLVTVSHFIGAQWTGILAAFPLVITSSVLLMTPRVGTPATAAAMATVIQGMVAYPLAYWIICARAVAWGPAWALLAALAVIVAWQGVVFAWRQSRSLPARSP